MEEQEKKDPRAEVREILLRAHKRLLEIQIPLDQCVQGRLYLLRSRNLPYGVFNGKDGFIGIREKFKVEYLFTEYYNDGVAPFGTASPMKDTGLDLPAEIPLVEDLGSVDANTRRPVVYEDKAWRFVDTKEADPAIRPVGTPNQALFDWINTQETNLAGLMGSKP